MREERLRTDRQSEREILGVGKGRGSLSTRIVCSERGRIEDNGRNETKEREETDENDRQNY